MRMTVSQNLKAVFTVLLCLVMVLACACAGDNSGRGGTRATPEGSSHGSENGGNDGNAGKGPAPSFSSEGGIYKSSIKITLSLPKDPPAGAYITYTENGDEPGPGSKKYGKEIEIKNTAVIRAAIFSSAGIQLGRIITNTYIIDPERAETNGLRIVALAADNNDLYSGEAGILSNRSGTGSAWERPVSVEIYEPDGGKLIHQDAGIRLAGSGSRSFDPASLRLIARKSGEFDENGVKYGGDGKFRADLFGTGFDSYDRFLLRNGGNDSPYQAREKFLRMDLLRDCITNDYCAGLSERTGVTVFAQHCVPVCVYLNGEYYGMSIMKEDFDERLVSELYGLEKDKITVIKGKKLYYQLESGDQAELDSWLELCDYAIDNAIGPDFAKAYERISKMIDVDNAASYLAVMLYLCNTDWPQNNAMVWRYTGSGAGDNSFSDGRWRFVIRDMDLCFALHDEPSRVSKTTYSMADTDTFYRLLVFYRDGKGYDFDSSLGLYGDDMKLQGLFDFLLRSADFRSRFISACGVLSSAEEAEYMAKTAAKYKDLAKDEMKRHIEFWKSKGKIYAAYDYSHWERSFNDIADFIADRPGYFEKYLRETMKYYE